MYVRRALLLVNACLIALVLWMATSLFLNWRSPDHRLSSFHNKPLADSSPASSEQGRKRDLSQYPGIQRVDMFKTRKATNPVIEPVSPAPTLELELIGTSVGDGTTSRAIVLDKRAGREEIIQVNGKIQGAQVIEILHDRAVFLVNGRKETRLIASLERSLAKSPEPDKKGPESFQKGKAVEIKRPVPREKQPLAPAGR